MTDPAGPAGLLLLLNTPACLLVLVLKLGMWDTSDTLLFLTTPDTRDV